MKLLITQPNLSAALAKGGAVAPKISPAPILTHLRLVAEGDFLKVASSDLDRFAESTALAKVEGEGAVCVNAAAFTALINRLPRDKDILLEIIETGPQTRHLAVKCGRSNSKLPTLAADQFPAWVDASGAVTFTMKGQDFATHFGRVRPMTEPTGPIYPQLQGVSATFEDGRLKLAATNTKVVGRTFAEVDAEGMPAMILPNEAIDAALRIFKGEDEVTIHAGENTVAFSNYAHRLGSKLIDGTFPANVEVVLQGETAATARVNRPDLAEAVDRAVLGSAKEGQWACVILIPRDGALEVKGANVDGNEVRDEIEAEIEGEFTFAAFAPSYLMSILAGAPDDDIEIRQHGSRLNHVIVTGGAPEYAAGIAALRSNSIMAG